MFEPGQRLLFPYFLLKDRFMNPPAARPTTPSPTRPLTLSLLAYASAISASVGAAAALVGAGVPLDVLVAMI